MANTRDGRRRIYPSTSVLRLGTDIKLSLADTPRRSQIGVDVSPNLMAKTSWQFNPAADQNP